MLDCCGQGGSLGRGRDASFNKTWTGYHEPKGYRGESSMVRFSINRTIDLRHLFGALSLRGGGPPPTPIVSLGKRVQAIGKHFIYTHGPTPPHHHHHSQKFSSPRESTGT